MISTVVIAMKRPTLNSSFCAIWDLVAVFLPTIVEYMYFCNQIVYLPQCIRQEPPDPAVRQDAEGPVQDEDGILDHRCPQEHRTEALLHCQGGISPLCNRFHCETLQE